MESRGCYLIKIENCSSEIIEIKIIIDKMMKILLLGSSGFIGRNILELLHIKYCILNPTHKDLDLLSLPDVTNYLSNHEVDTVIHCANVGGTRKCLNSGDTLEKNVRLFFNLFENRDKYDTLITLGSGAEYDKAYEISKISESEFGKKIPKDEYGFSKYIISRIVESSEKMYCLRLFGIFGKYEDYEFKFISNAILKNLLHLPISIRQNVNFSWLYINDFIEILEYFIKKNPKYSSYNITPPIAIDLVTIANLINEVSDFKSEIVIENNGLNLEYSGSNSLLVGENQNITFTPMKTAILELMEYYRLIIDTIDPEVIKQDKYAAYCKINDN